MPSSAKTAPSHYVERIRDAASRTKNGLARESGVSRECTGNIQHC